MSDDRWKNSSKEDWNDDRYQSLIIQRNLFLIIIFACILIVAIAIVIIGVINKKKSIEPMVVEVENTTGITNIVNPETDRDWTVNKTMNKYFIYHYISARETYNVSTYEYNYNTVVRLMSSSSVYSKFIQEISKPETNPVNKYGSNVSTSLAIRSILFVDSSAGQSAQIRIAITASDGKIVRKVLYITWTYATMSFTFKERMINPLGFQVLAYSIADDIDV